uniref:tRNase Z TRZ1-like n=1 Tax=Erigeron canadensis TaxID=72917 RepID=UPI001CB89979|nr:tRNase Z TRZ1-like [Erigeron canadensis]
MNDFLVIENYQFDGVSKAGHKTCVILRTLNLAFDMGKCPELAVSQVSSSVLTQGYVIYERKPKLKPKYLGLPQKEKAKLKLSGVEIDYLVESPEVGFTGDTTADFIVNKDNVDVLKAKILIMESTYLDKTKPVEDAREYGHTHLSEIIDYADRFENKAILLIHFSRRYTLDDIEKAISALPPSLAGRVFALKKGFDYSSKKPNSSLQNTGSSLSGKSEFIDSRGAVVQIIPPPERMWMLEQKI